MSKVIVVCGQAGVGKTTLSAELSKKLNIVCFHKDTIKERLFELLEGENLEDSKKLGMCSMELLFHLGEEAIRNGIDVIAEAPFNHPSNPEIFERWKNELGADVRVIICELSDDIEHVRRFRERRRHHSHQDFDRGWQPTPFDYSVMPGSKQ
jgi:predicted kinase